MTTTTTQAQEWTSAGTYTFTVPAGVTSAWLTMIGGGGGGSGLLSTTNAIGRSGGGSGEFCFRLPVILPAGTVSVVVGAKGAGGDASGSTPGCNGNDGTASTFWNYTANPGKGAESTTAIPLGGDGGGILGIVQALAATQASIKYELYGFAGGGAGGTGTGGATGFPSPSLNGFTGTSGGAGGRPGSDGAPSPWGNGGIGASGIHNTGGNAPATSYGAGGGGCSGTGTPLAPYAGGGDGADGYVLIEWIGA